jgi:hypothetical protein
MWEVKIKKACKSKDLQAFSVTFPFIILVVIKIKRVKISHTLRFDVLFEIHKE